MSAVPAMYALETSGPRSVDWWLADRRPGYEGRVLGQPPNTSALVTYGALGVAGVARLAGQDAVARVAALIGAGGSLVWSADELTRGVNPLRRLVGGVSLAGTLLLIARRVVR